MAIAKDNRRVQAIIAAALRDKIGRLAEALSVSESRAIEMLLDAAISDPKRLAAILAERYGTAIKELQSGWLVRGGKRSESDPNQALLPLTG